MKKVLVLALVLMSLFAGRQSFAAKGELNIAVVDVQTVIEATKEGRKAKDMLNKETAERQTMIENKRNEVKKLEDEFNQKQLVYNATVREEKQKELQAMMYDWQKMVMDSEKTLKQKYASVSQDIVKKIQGVVTKLSTDRGYDLVLEKSQTQFFKNSFDITTDVTKAYDQAYK